MNDYFLKYKQNSNESRFLFPDNLLKSYIAHYTFSVSYQVPGSSTLTLIPDASGCLVFRISSEGLRCAFWGPTTKTVVVDNKVDNDECLFFVEFTPAGAHRLFGLSLHELTDRKIPLEDIDRSAAAVLFQFIEAAASWREVAAWFDRFFLERLTSSGETPFIKNLLPRLCCDDEQISVRDVSEWTCYSERHLNRIFRTELGISLKKYLRIQRINKVLTSLDAGQHNLTFLSQSAGYYDQSHFNHDFKSVCGVPPGQYLKNMSDYYNEPYKF